MIISHMRFPFVLVVALAAVAMFACGEAARNQLAEKGIAYNVDSFVERAGAGDLPAVRLFLKAGMDVDAKATGGRFGTGFTALYEASLKGRAEVVQFLIKKGADVNVRNFAYKTALTASALGGHAKIAKLLVENGAAIDSKDRYGQTALMSAAIGGHAEIIKLFVAKGADVHAKAGYDQTPLSYAVTAGSVDSVRLLLEQGAKANIRESLTGQTPLDLTSNPEIIRMLKAAGGKSG